MYTGDILGGPRGINDEVEKRERKKKRLLFLN
jgi:hypothetical protein